MIDSHAHLGADAADVLERAHAAGVTRVVAVATTVAGARDVLALADRHDGVYACLGVHPHEAGRRPATSPSCATLLAHPKAVAVGETGLDYFRDYAPHDAQQRLFEAGARARARAGQAGRDPHARRRRRHAGTRSSATTGTVILHCFSSPPLLDAALAHDWYVSFAGNVTYKNAYDLRDCARRVPSERLLVETDSPYLAAQAVRGRRNEPAYVVHTYDFLSELRGEDVRTLADANATRAFGLP